MVLSLSFKGAGGSRVAAAMVSGGASVIKQKPRGALIVFEGLDRSGKSTQSKALASYLRAQGQAVEEWRFPDRTTAIGTTISSYLSKKSELDDAAIHLLFAANRWEKRTLMEDTLMRGTTLIVDRYAYSGVVFTAAKGLDLQWCKEPDKGLLAADLVLYLNISPEVAAMRGEYGQERYEKLDFQKKVASHYEALRDNRWEYIDASQSLDEVQNCVREAANSTIDDCRSGRSLSRLWLMRQSIVGAVADAA